MSFAHFTLATRDVPKTRRFFEETLLWKGIDHPDNIPMDAAWLEIAPGQQVHLLRVSDFAPSPFEREYGRHVAIFYPPDQFPALKERLTSHGAELIAPLRPTPVERFFFKEPNGYVFEVIARP